MHLFNIFKKIPGSSDISKKNGNWLVIPHGMMTKSVLFFIRISLIFGRLWHRKASRTNILFFLEWHWCHTVLSQSWVSASSIQPLAWHLTWYLTGKVFLFKIMKGLHFRTISIDTKHNRKSFFFRLQIDWMLMSLVPFEFNVWDDGKSNVKVACSVLLMSFIAWLCSFLMFSTIL